MATHELDVTSFLLYRRGNGGTEKLLWLEVCALETV